MPERQSLCYLQRSRAFTVAFTSENENDDQKKFTPPLAIDPEFFHCEFANPCTV
jgi:hypothetical protein